MDHIFWKNINDLGERPDLLEESTNILNFSYVFGGASLFHYFSDSSELIEVIHNKYFAAFENDVLTPEEKIVPLVLLKPDSRGKTALELAQEFKRPKGFNLMINMLINFYDFSFSKMILSQLIHLVSFNTEIPEKFFDNSYF